jgi:methionine aminopeptidase
MSMAGNPSLMVDIMANNAMLGAGLAQAEAQVKQSADRMGREVDSRMTKLGAQITRRLASAIGAGFAINALDQTLRAGIEAVKAGGTFNDAGIAFGEQLEKSIRSLPVVGAIGGAFADAFLFGLDSVLDYIPQWAKDLDRKMAENIPAPLRILFPFLGGMLSGVEDMRTEGKQEQSRAEALENQRTQARLRDAEISRELESLQNRQRGMSPIEEQLQRMGSGATASVDTALGSFRIGEADASAQLVKAAREQVDLLAKIKDLQAEQAANLKLTN